MNAREVLEELADKPVEEYSEENLRELLDIANEHQRILDHVDAWTTDSFAKKLIRDNNRRRIR